MEKKLTDEEIVNAYEHCYVNEGTCKSCCLFDEDKLCVSNEDVLDLINRQKAEIERLTEENEYLDMNAKQFLADYQKSEVEVVELKETISKTIKDTAKEIWFKAKLLERQEDGYDFPLYTFGQWLNEKFGVEVE